MKCVIFLSGLPACKVMSNRSGRCISIQPGLSSRSGNFFAWLHVITTATMSTHLQLCRQTHLRIIDLLKATHARAPAEGSPNLATSISRW